MKERLTLSFLRIQSGSFENEKGFEMGEKKRRAERRERRKMWDGFEWTFFLSSRDMDSRRRLKATEKLAVAEGRRTEVAVAVK